MKIILATGGSGGHLFPALSVAKEFQRDGHKILFLGSFKRNSPSASNNNSSHDWNLGEKKIKEAGFTSLSHDAKGFNKNQPTQWLTWCITLVRACYRSLLFVKEFNPDVVLGFGGYGAFPVVLAASILRRPTLIHEQNVIPGKANRFLSPLVRKVAITFRESQKYFHPGKTVLTGCPSHHPPEHADKNEILKKFHLQEGRSTILVFGGSQGSQRINEVFVETAKALEKRFDFQVIHITGKRDCGRITQKYRDFQSPLAVFEFLDEIEQAFSVADLVISRAGAVTVTEIAAFERPAILIPYPHAHEHQQANALILCEMGMASVIKDKDLSVETLTAGILKGLHHDQNQIQKKQLSKNIYFSDSSSRLANEALKLIR